MSVADGVGETLWGIDSGRSGDPKQRVPDHLDVQPGCIGLRHCLDCQHPAGRIEVVVQCVDGQGAVGGQQPQIVFWHRLKPRGVRVIHIDPNATLRVVGTICDRVEQRVVSCLGRREANGSRLVIRFHLYPLGSSGDLHELQVIGIGVRVVAARVKRDGVTDGGDIVVVVGHRGRVGGSWRDLGTQFPRGRVPAVRDRQVHGAPPRPFLSDVLHRDVTIRTPRHLKTVVIGSGLLKVDGITIRIYPVGKHRISNRCPLAQVDLAVTDLVGCGVFILRAQVDRDGGDIRDVHPIEGLVGKRDRPLRICGHLNAKRTPLFGLRDLDPFGDFLDYRGQHVTVEVNVVAQDRKHRRSSRPGTQFIVHGLRRVLLLGELAVLGLLGLLGLFLRLVVHQLGLDLLPVVHLHHLFQRQKDITGDLIVDDDHLPVGTENRLLGTCQHRMLSPFVLIPPTVTDVVAGFRPQRIGAAVQLHRRGWFAARDALPRHSARGDLYLEQLRRRGDDNRS